MVKAPHAVAVDEDGYFLFDFPGNPDFAGKPGTAPSWDAPPGFFRPRWDGAAWVEGEEPGEVERQTIARVAATERAWRNAELARADIAINRASDDAIMAISRETEEEAGARVIAWTRYRIALRDMPQQSADPRQWTRPKAPQA